MDDLCRMINDLLLLKEYVYFAVIEWLTTNRPTTNRHPIVDILPFISVEMVFSLLSNVRLHGMDTRPQPSTSLLLY